MQFNIFLTIFPNFSTINYSPYLQSTRLSNIKIDCMVIIKEIGGIGNLKYSLSFSDIDDCVDRPCENGATCIDGVSHYNCSCAAGYTEKDCSIGKKD